MRYIKRYDDLINEKISWKEILLWSSIFIASSQFKSEYNKYQYLKSIYTLVNSENKPKGKDREICENIRKSIINDINNSPKWIKFDKKRITDSITSIQFIIIDSSDVFMDEKLGCFINLESIKNKKSISNKLLSSSEPIENNIIAINRSVLSSPMCEDVVKHELYHYVSKLKNYPFSTLKNDFVNITTINKFIDKKTSDKVYLSKKISILLFLRRNEFADLMKMDINKFEMTDHGKSVDLYTVAKHLVDGYQQKVNYYENDDEIFARWHVLKSDIYKSGIKKDKITTEDIQKYLLTIKSVDEFQEAIDILLPLDWGKLDEFQDFVKLNS